MHKLVRISYGSVILLLAMGIGACAPKSSKKGENETPCQAPDCQSAETSQEGGQKLPPQTTPAAPCQEDSCRPTDPKNDCTAQGFHQANAIASHPMRAAYCLNYAKQNRCQITEDWIVTCMTLGSDLKPEDYRLHVRNILSNLD